MECSRSSLQVFVIAFGALNYLNEVQTGQNRLCRNYLCFNHTPHAERKQPSLKHFSNLSVPPDDNGVLGQIINTKSRHANSGKNEDIVI
jgi:hypothetical protein